MFFVVSCSNFVGKRPTSIQLKNWIRKIKKKLSPTLLKRKCHKENPYSTRLNPLHCKFTIAPTEHTGWGLFATDDIQINESIVRYTGCCVNRSEASDLNLYYFNLERESNGGVMNSNVQLDGSPKCNLGNHSFTLAHIFI